MFTLVVPKNCARIVPMKCQKRLPEQESAGWTFSLVCQLDVGHDGPCNDDQAVRVFAEHIIPVFTKQPAAVGQSEQHTAAQPAQESPSGSDDNASAPNADRS